MKFPFILVVFLLKSVICDNVTISDTCNYRGYRPQYLCGDVCLDYFNDCDCGGQVIEYGWDYEYCCVPASVHCTKTERTDWYGYPVYRCPQGEVLSMKSPTPCNATGQCYNDILTSEHIGSRAHYTFKDKCITGDDLCQGVSFCDGDEEVCGPQLRCPEDYTRYNMSTDTSRYYCYKNDDSIKTRPKV